MKMELPASSILPSISGLLLCLLSAAFAQSHEDFLQCLSLQPQFPSNVIFIKNSTHYTDVLQLSLKNLRFSTAYTPKPLVIITPIHVFQIQATVLCAKKTGLQIRTRSGGHDYEGLSYSSNVPFILVDMINLRSINVDAENRVAWVQTGATIGELYYRIAEKSTKLGFPAGVCPTVGVGGHFSGGGYGMMMRKYGLAADNIIDAEMVDVNGNVLDRRLMGEDLFWAIRGGGAASFGIILSWKISLVPVPSTVTVFTVTRNLQQNATQLVHRWQHVAHKLHEGLFIRLFLEKGDSNQKAKQTIVANFTALFLGESEKLLPLMQKDFPELWLKKEDCIEMSWIESALYFYNLPIGEFDMLLDRTHLGRKFYKAKSDYVTEQIPVEGLEGIWKLLFEKPFTWQLIMSPYGGIMNEIAESETPFPHRARNLYSLHYMVSWEEEEMEASWRQISLIRKLYSYLTPYVSRSPRAAYVNDRDLDIGSNIKLGNTSYNEASVWGVKYFKNNFRKLVKVKTEVDPANFFKNEQSIPSFAESQLVNM